MKSQKFTPSRWTPDGCVPLVEALLAHAQANRSSWHTPGHQQGGAWPAFFHQGLSLLDQTELPLLDDLNQPTGPAREAMQAAANAFGAGYTRFLTGGSTTSIYILLAAAVGTGGKVLTAGTCHQSVLHAAALLGLNLVSFEQTGFPDHEDPDQPRLSFLPQATVEDVQRGLRDHPDCQAVWLTSPDYYGSCAQLEAIASCVQAHKKSLLVDEAHGAHLAFGPELLPVTALAAGADGCVQSGHKTLPVLTGGSYLHISHRALKAGTISAEAVDRLIPVFQSSSPSFPIAASLDLARAMMVSEGDERIRCQLEQLAVFSEAVRRHWLCRPLRTGPQAVDHDPLRLVLTPRDPGAVSILAALADQLQEAGVDVEFSDLTRLVLIPSLWQDEQAWVQLADLLNGFDSQIQALTNQQRDRSKDLWALEKTWARQLRTMQFPCGQGLRQTLLARQKRQDLPLEQATGRMLSRALAPYPPGLALLAPGAQLTREVVALLSRLLDNGVEVSGVIDGQVSVLM